MRFSIHLYSWTFFSSGPTTSSETLKLQFWARKSEECCQPRDCNWILQPPIINTERTLLATWSVFIFIKNDSRLLLFLCCNRQTVRCCMRLWADNANSKNWLDNAFLTYKNGTLWTWLWRHSKLWGKSASSAEPDFKGLFVRAYKLLQ